MSEFDYLRHEIEVQSQQLSEEEIIKIFLYLREETIWVSSDGTMSPTNAYLDKLDQIFMEPEEYQKQLRKDTKKIRTKKMQEWKEKREILMKYGLGGGPQPVEFQKIYLFLLKPSIQKMNRRLFTQDDYEIKRVHPDTLKVIIALIQYLLYRHGYVQMKDLLEIVERYKDEFGLPSARQHLHSILKKIANWGYIQKKGKRWKLNELK